MEPVDYNVQCAQFTVSALYFFFAGGAICFTSLFDGIINLTVRSMGKNADKAAAVLFLWFILSVVLVYNIVGVIYLYFF